MRTFTKTFFISLIVQMILLAVVVFGFRTVGEFGFGPVAYVLYMLEIIPVGIILSSSGLRDYLSDSRIPEFLLLCISAAVYSALIGLVVWMVSGLRRKAS